MSSYFSVRLRDVVSKSLLWDFVKLYNKVTLPMSSCCICFKCVHRLQVFEQASVHFE